MNKHRQARWSTGLNPVLWDSAAFTVEAGKKIVEVDRRKRSFRILTDISVRSNGISSLVHELRPNPVRSRHPANKMCVVPRGVTPRRVPHVSLDILLRRGGVHREAHLRRPAWSRHDVGGTSRPEARRRPVLVVFKIPSKVSADPPLTCLPSAALPPSSRAPGTPPGAR